ncbi:TPA: hypothetical protein U2B07_000713 [Streptococcus suis]|nr:hypothetical protein [Streptococcus suis]
MARLIASNQLTLTNVNDGQTAVVHWAYSDNADGTGLTTSDNGQRYIGHYSDYTQADSTDKTKYRWADRWAKIDIGIDNLLVNTVSLANNVSKATVNTLDKYNGGTIAKGVAPRGSYRDIYRQQMKIAPVGNVFIGSFYAKSTLDGHEIDCHLFSPNRTIKAMSSDGYTWTNVTGGDGRTTISLSTEWKRYWVVWTIRDATSEAENIPMTVIFCRNKDTVNEVSLALPALYTGNINKEHSLAPEDVQANIDTKADQALTKEQINLLNEQAGIIQAELEAKASLDTVNNILKQIKDMKAADEATWAKVEKDLITHLQRVIKIETNLGDQAQRWNAVDTFMQVSNDGLSLGKADGSSSMLFSPDGRITMFSSGTPVMYVDKGVIHIDDGIFSKTVQIGRFREEQYHNNPDINNKRYVGG